MQHTPAELLLEARLVNLAYKHASNSVRNIEFLFTEMDGIQYLSFKGTSSNKGPFSILSFLWDVLTDVRFIPRTDNTYGLGRHPAGFLDAAEDLVAYIVSNDTNIDPYKPIHLSGHSLGGAVLLIAAPVMVAHGLIVDSVITFGSPNVGSLEQLSGTRTTCLKNGLDLITYLPPFYGDTNPTTVIKGNAKGFICDHRLDSYIDSLIQLEKGRAFYV